MVRVMRLRTSQRFQVGDGLDLIAAFRMAEGGCELRSVEASRLEAEEGPWLKASKQTRTSELQLQGSEVSQHLNERASRFIPRGSSK